MIQRQICKEYYSVIEEKVIKTGFQGLVVEDLKGKYTLSRQHREDNGILGR